MALAYFFTFTTYGTWLHGDDRNSVDSEHRVFGEPFVPSDPKRFQRMRDLMKQPAYALDETARGIVCEAIVALAQRRNWRLLALHVRTTHVHLVVAFPEGDPDRMLSDMKSAASAALTQHGIDDSTRKRWTRHGSTRHLFQEESVRASVKYTLDEQGVPMARWCSPDFEQPE